MHRRVLVLVVLAAIVGVIVWRMRARESSESTSTTGSGTPTGSTTSDRPALPSVGGSAESAPGPERSTPDFLQKRGEAVMRFQGDVMNRLMTCVGPQTKPSTPRNVRFIFEWQRDRSQTQMQMFTVREAVIDDVAGLSDASRQCVERMRGMPMMLPVATTELPRDSHLFEQLVMLPIP